MDWREVYQLPFTYDVNGGYVWANNGTMTLTFDFDYDYGERRCIAKKIVDKLNGDTSIKFDSDFTLYDNIYFHYGKEFVFCIRGWGELTSQCCRNLTSEDAANVQDNFAKWILETLNN
jgi:hypothetical protein